MKTIHRSAHTLVKVPLQTAFEYVSDLTRHPEWSNGELKIEPVTSEPIGAGKEYLSKGTVANIQKDRPNKLTVTEYEPPNTFGFAASDSDFGRVLHTFTFSEEDGGTLITRTMTFTLRPLMAFIFQFFIFPFLGKPDTERSLAKLKAQLEMEN
jgi:uncharacterized protein YndB with AHSA1/START domain